MCVSSGNSSLCEVPPAEVRVPSFPESSPLLSMMPTLRTILRSQIQKWPDLFDWKAPGTALRQLGVLQKGAGSE